MVSLSRLLSIDKFTKPEERLGIVPSGEIVYKRSITMAWPAAMESVLIGLVGAIDTMMVGTIGPHAIAAVGITTQPKFLLMAMMISLSLATTTVVARRKGENDEKGANSCLKQVIVISSLLSVILSVIGIIFSRPLLEFAGAGPDMVDEATAYFVIIVGGMIFTCLSLIINAAQRGVGNTKIAMRTNIVANIVNIILNYLLIGGNFRFPELGVRGAAIATVAGSIVAFLMSLSSVIKRDRFLNILRKEDSWKIERRTISVISSLSLSALVEQLSLRIGFFFYAKIVAGLGTIAFATHQICMNIINISFCFGDGFRVAVSSLVGQSLGEKRPDMAKIYVRALNRIMKVISFFLFIFFIVGRRFLVALFSSDKQIIDMGEPILIIIAVATLSQTAALIYSGCLRGAGDARYTALMSAIIIGVIRPVSAWVFCYPLGLGLNGAWLSLLLDQTLRCVAFYTRFKGGKWDKIKV